MHESSLVENAKKITILRSGALGDFLVILPAVKAIREAYPKAEISILGRPWLENFFYQRTPFDKFIEVPIIKGIREEGSMDYDHEEVVSFLSKMRSEKFDIAIQLQGMGVSANPLIKSLGAKLTVGLYSEKSEELDRAIYYYYYQNEMVRSLEVAKLIGATASDLEPKVNVLNEDLLEAECFLNRYQIVSYIVLHPFAMDLRRTWPTENFRVLGDLLSEAGYSIVFTGSKEDKESVSKIISKMKTNAVNACGQLSLGGLGGLLARSALVISSDTGPLHLARAVNAKTVGIYWAPNLINWGPLFRNDHRPVISWQMECPICGIIPNNPYPFEPKGETCQHNISFVKNVKVEQVMEVALSLLNSDVGSAMKV